MMTYFQMSHAKVEYFNPYFMVNIKDFMSTFKCLLTSYFPQTSNNKLTYSTLWEKSLRLIKDVSEFMYTMYVYIKCMYDTCIKHKCVIIWCEISIII